MPLRSIGAEQIAKFLLETSAVAWTLGPNGYVVDVPQWEALTGQSGDEVAGDGWLAAVHPDDVARVKSAWETALAHASHYNTDYRIRCADGIYRWFNARGAPVLAQDGRVQQWFGVVLAIAGPARLGTCLSPVGLAAIDEVELTPALTRAARALLGWSADELAARADVSLSTVRRLESEGGDAQPRKSSTERVSRVLISAGVTFSRANDGTVAISLARLPGASPASRTSADLETGQA